MTLLDHTQRESPIGDEESSASTARNELQDEGGDHDGVRAATEEKLISSGSSKSADGDKQELIDVEQQMSALDHLRRIAEDLVTIPVAFILGTAKKPRRFLYDRCDGTSDYHDHRRPPCPIFYVPIPVKWFPDLLEQNSLCESFGRVGCMQPYDYRLRRWIFGVATVCQLLAFGMTFYAAFAISMDYNVLHKVSFTRGMGRIVGGRQFDFFEHPIDIDIGLLRVAVGDPHDLSGYHGRVMKWDEFCYNFTDGFQEFFGISACEDCGKTSRSLVASMGMSLLFSIPSFTTDVLRFYPDYDVGDVTRDVIKTGYYMVNCQKFFGSVVSFISMGFSLYTWLSYFEVCVTTFYDRELGIYINGTRALDLESADLIIKMDWKGGWGYYCVFTATVLKIVDVICNLAVPTPRICRDHAEQAMYEVIAINRDARVGDTSRYTTESLRMLHQSVSEARARMGSTRHEYGEDSSEENSERTNPLSSSRRHPSGLLTVNEDATTLEKEEGSSRHRDEEEGPSLFQGRNLGRDQSEPVLHVASSNAPPGAMEVHPTPTPSPVRLTKSVYF